jgi:hypothetical protein
MLPRFDSPIHAEVRPKIVVPNWREFENEMWIETTLHRVVSEQMGDTLEWLHGTRTWVSPSSRFSTLMLQIRLRQIKMDQAMQQQLRRVASIIQSVSPEAGGPSIPRPGFGFMPTQRAANPNT